MLAYVLFIELRTEVIEFRAVVHQNFRPNGLLKKQLDAGCLETSWAEEEEERALLM